MSIIKTKADVDFVMHDFINANVITADQALVVKEVVLNIVTHKSLKPYFTTDDIVYNERDIIGKSGIMYRPDRLIINKQNQVTILDYKTGAQDRKHIVQLEAYENVLLEMNFKVSKKILVYINDGIEVKEF